jgi:ParB family chromosome partitioning protein
MTDIPLDLIVPNPEQPRTEFDPGELDGLAQSIREHGVILPVVVEEAAGVYILHDGERRVLAARLAGLTEIPAVVIAPLNGDGPQKRLLRALVANLQRVDLSPIEEARAYLKLRNLGLSTNQIAEQTGKHVSQIYNRLKLLEDYEPEIQELIHRGKFSSSELVRKALVKLPKHERLELAVKAAERELSVRTIITAASVLRKRSQAESRPQERRSLDVAFERRDDRPVDRMKWNAAAQAGIVPPWPAVEKAARQTCRRCVLASAASPEICRECPAPTLLVMLMESVEKVEL